MTAYRASKLACMLFGSELARKAAAAGSSLVSVNVHPGVAATNLFDSMIPKLPGLHKAFYFGMGLVLQDERQGAESELYAASMPDVQPDDYLGPTQLTGARGPVARAPRSKEARDPCRRRSCGRSRWNSPGPITRDSAASAAGITLSPTLVSRTVVRHYRCSTRVWLRG